MLKDELEANGTTVHLLTLDVTDEQASRDAVQATVNALGRLDVLVNNAGFAQQ